MDSDLVVTSSSGRVFFLEVGDTDNLLQTLACSQGEVLAVTKAPKMNLLFFSGNDSNIYSVAKNAKTEKYSVLSKIRGQSHAVHALFCLDYKVFAPRNEATQGEAGKNESALNKLLSGGETSDICVMDFNQFGFSRKATISDSTVQKMGFRHVLEPLENLLKTGNASEMFLRRGSEFIEVVKVESLKSGSGSNPKYRPVFSFEHSKAISSVSFCQDMMQFAYFSLEDLELVILDMKTGERLASYSGLYVSQVTFSSHHLILFDVLDRSLKFFKKRSKYGAELNVFRTIEVPTRFVDSIQLDVRERFALLNDHLSRKCFFMSIHSKGLTDLSRIYKQNHLIKLIQLHPLQDKVYFVNNNNNVFFYCMKRKITVKVDTGKHSIPRNIQVFNICFSLSDPTRLRLVGDYHIISVDSSETPKVRVERKTERVVNLQQIIDKKSRFCNQLITQNV